MLTEEDALHEETPLLVQAEALESGPSHAGLSKHDKQYTRFSPSQKRAIVGLLSWVGLLPCKSFSFSIFFTSTDVSSVVAVLASGSFVPSVPEIARELNSTGPVIKYVSPS